MVCVVSVWREGSFFRLSHILEFGLPPCSVELSPLSCRAVLLERRFVLLGYRVSSAMRFHGVGLEDCVPLMKVFS